MKTWSKNAKKRKKTETGEKERTQEKRKDEKREQLSRKQIKAKEKERKRTMKQEKARGERTGQGRGRGKVNVTMKRIRCFIVLPFMGSRPRFYIIVSQSVSEGVYACIDLERANVPSFCDAKPTG